MKPLKPIVNKNVNKVAKSYVGKKSNGNPIKKTVSMGPIPIVPVVNLEGKTVCSKCRHEKRNKHFVSGKLTKRLSKLCFECREYGKKYDKKRRAEAAKMPIDHPTDDTLKFCIHCRHYNDKDGFLSLAGKPTVHCGDCLERSRIIEDGRKGTRGPTETSRAYERLETTIARHKKWNKDNPDKYKSYYKNHRNKVRMENAAAVRARNAEKQRERRKKSPERYRGYHKKYKKTLNYRLSYYKTRAINKGIEWELTNAQFKKLCLGDCYYCKSTAENSEHGFNGIDRVDSDDDYTFENSRSCCTNCNMSKGQLPFEQYMAYCARIVAFKFKEINLDNVANLISSIPYSCSNGVPYCDYSYRANKKSLEMSISIDEFNSMVSENCYLCGNFPGEQCGIDRVDNSIGYVIGNCEPCCANCNMLKRDQNLEEFLERCKSTVENFFQDGEFPVYIEKKRMASNKKDVVKLTIDEKSYIRESHRAAMNNWGLIQSRVDLNIATEDEIQQINKLHSDIKAAQKALCEEKKRIMITQDEKSK